MKTYTDEQKKYIMSKIPDIRFDAIPEGIKDFWINWKNKRDETNINEM